MHDLILYVENPKELQKELLEQVSNYSKVAIYKISIYVNCFLYASNSQYNLKLKVHIVLL